MTASLPPGSAAKGLEAGKTKKPRQDSKPVKPKRGFFSIEPVAADILDDEAEHRRVDRMFRILRMQGIAIAVLAVGLLAGTPFFKTVYQYYAIDPSRSVVRLVPLTMPNMTNQAILSWATNSITEIMTFGFGDYISHLSAQQVRFTTDGWASFVSAFDKSKIGQTFRERQLVLTTVPSDTAVILSQGENEKHVYEWHVQMPVIMTYATNDNVTRRDKAVVDLTISRIPPSQSPIGIAIKSWRQG